MPRALVPLEALHASERVREGAEAAHAEAQAQLVRGVGGDFGGRVPLLLPCRLCCCLRDGSACAGPRIGWKETFFNHATLGSLLCARATPTYLTV